MEFDMNRKHKEVISFDKASYKKEIERFRDEKNIPVTRLSEEVGMSKTYLKNVNDVGRINIEVLEKLEKMGMNIKILSPVTIREIKSYFDEVDTHKLSTRDLAENFYRYYEAKNWHCKNGKIISRANVKYVLSRWYEREIESRFGTEYKIVKEKKKVPKKASKRATKPSQELIGLRLDIERLETDIEDLNRALDKGLLEVEKNIIQKLDELSIKKLLFRK